MDLLTKSALQKWVDQRLFRAKLVDPIRQRRAHNNIRAILRNARSLFTNELLELESAPSLNVSPPPFHEIKSPSRAGTSYVSRFNAKTLLTKAAKDELALPPTEVAAADQVLRFEQWKTLYLALFAGLRYNEIDRLMAQDIAREEGTINVRLHEDFIPKTAASEGQVLVSEDARKVISSMLDHTENGYQRPSM